MAANAPRSWPADLLAGRTALVTGAFGGLGLHFARVLAAHGAQVALAGRRIELGRGVAAEIGAAVGRPADVRAYALDVTDGAGVAAALERIAAEMGAPSIVVNNAGTVARAPRSTSSSAAASGRAITRRSGSSSTERGHSGGMNAHDLTGKTAFVAA